MTGNLHQFGKCSLDADRKVLWFENEPVALPRKAVELLSLLVERRGEVVTKDEIWTAVWQDAFVEETNLTHNIYLLRKTLKDLGEPDLIQTVPRRGYRFADHLAATTGDELVIEKHSVTRTLVEELPPQLPYVNRSRSRARELAIASVFLIAIVFGGAALWNRWSRGATAASTPIRSLAVLPLTPVNPTDDDAALGLGIADALITRLSKRNTLRIVSTKTASRYADTTKEPAEIGRELGVEAVLDGTLQRSDEKIRVSLRLIRSADGVQIWSALIGDSENEIFRLQDALAFQTAQALNLNPRPADDTKLPTTDLAAYHQFLRGDYLFRLRGQKNVELSIPFFREAVRQDPNFARAWAGWAAALAVGTDIPNAESMLDKALDLDPDLAEAHATRGFIQMFHYWKWSEAEVSLNRAIELDPNSLQAHHWRGVLLSIHGRFDEAKVEMERALELDPVSLNINADLGQLYFLSRQNDRAEEFCERALAIDPNYGMAHGYLWRIYESKGKGDEAFEHYVRGMCWTAGDDNGESCSANFREAYARGGWSVVYSEGAEKALDLVRHRSNANAYYYLALHALRTGDRDKLLEYLDRSLKSKAEYEGMNFTFPYINVDPQFDSVRRDPRFIAFLRELNFS